MHNRATLRNVHVTRIMCAGKSIYLARSPRSFRTASDLGQQAASGYDGHSPLVTCAAFAANLPAQKQS
jgi:hypothetical protein